MTWTYIRNIELVYQTQQYVESTDKDYKRGLGSNDAARKTEGAYDRDLKAAWPQKSSLMATAKPTNAQL